MGTVVSMANLNIPTQTHLTQNTLPVYCVHMKQALNNQSKAYYSYYSLLTEASFSCPNL